MCARLRIEIATFAVPLILKKGGTASPHCRAPYISNFLLLFSPIITKQQLK